MRGILFALPFPLRNGKSFDKLNRRAAPTIFLSYPKSISSPQKSPQSLGRASAPLCKGSSAVGGEGLSVTEGD